MKSHVHASFQRRQSLLGQHFTPKGKGGEEQGGRGTCKAPEWYLQASQMRKKAIVRKRTRSPFCLLLLSSQPRLQPASLVLREDLGHPSEITQPPWQAVPSTNKPLAALLFPRTYRSSSELSGYGGDLPAQPGMSRPGPPLPFPKAPFHPPCSPGSSPNAGSCCRQSRAGLRILPCHSSLAGITDHSSCLTLNHVGRTWAVAPQLLVPFTRSSGRAWKKAGQSPPPNHLQPPPLATCRSCPEALQERAAYPTPPALPAEAECPEGPFQETHGCSVSACTKQHPALPSAADPRQLQRQPGENQPAQHAPTCVRSPGGFSCDCSARLCSFGEAKSFLFQTGRRTRSCVSRAAAIEAPAGWGGVRRAATSLQ